MILSAAVFLLEGDGWARGEGVEFAELLIQNLLPGPIHPNACHRTADHDPFLSATFPNGT